MCQCKNICGIISYNNQGARFDDCNIRQMDCQNCKKERMFMLQKLNLETFTLDFCQIEQLITCLRPLGHKKWLHSTSLFTILVFCWGVTFSLFLCQFVINDVMMHDVTNVNIMWALVMFIFMFMLESSWHLALDVWLVVYVWAMGKYQE